MKQDPLALVDHVMLTDAVNKLLRVREKGIKFNFQQSTSSAEKRKEEAEEENVARRWHIAKQQKQALERLVQAFSS